MIENEYTDNEEIKEINETPVNEEPIDEEPSNEETDNEEPVYDEPSEESVNEDPVEKEPVKKERNIIPAILISCAALSLYAYSRLQCSYYFLRLTKAHL